MAHPKSTAASRMHKDLKPHQIVLRPLVTEKGMHRSTRNNAYAFEVNPQANKEDVRYAIEELFNVKVLRVNISKVQPKPKRRGMVRGSRPGWKKAIVQIREGDSIPIFEGAQVS